jgi:hypothetical protein
VALAGERPPGTRGRGAAGDLVVGGDEEDRGDVEQRARAAEERQDEDRDADDDRVDAEVPTQAAGDAGDHPVGARPQQAPA